MTTSRFICETILAGIGFTVMLGLMCVIEIAAGVVR